MFYHFLLSLSKWVLPGIHTHAAEHRKVEELLYLRIQYSHTIPSLPFLLSKISRLFVLYSFCTLWHVSRGKWSLSHVFPLCLAGGAGTGEMPSQLPHPCAWSEFCSKGHQIYFIPFYTPLGSSCNPAFWFRSLWDGDIVVSLSVTCDIDDKTSQRNNGISSNTVSPGTMSEH